MRSYSIKPPALNNKTGLLHGEDLPIGMVQAGARALLHRRIARDHYLLRLKSPVVARSAQPGQFIHVRCSRADHPLLRRPFSLLDTDPQAGTIDFIYKVVGCGTRVLTQIPVGEQMDILGPLGQPFMIPDEMKTAYLVGGGVGIPPMVLLARHLLRRKQQVETFLGARTKEWVICRPQFQALGIPIQVATDDGTLGHRGSVVDLLERSFRAIPPDPRTTLLYICGPTPMMAAAAELARRHRLPAQVSLEERMGCAMGCCMGCVVEVTTEPVHSHARFQRVCTEGPVFPAAKILWHEN